MSLFGAAGQWLSLSLKLKRAKSAIEREGRMYDVKITLIKGGKSLLMGVAAVAAAAAVGYLGDTVAVTEALKHGGMSDILVLALVPVIKAAATMVGNYLKHS